MVENSTEKTLDSEFNWKEVEEKWRKRWTENKIFESEFDSNKKKYFLTVAYPYPNSPQHVGHGRTYTLADVHARYKRMKNYNVLFPMGFHYTGTPIVSMSQRIKSNDIELIETFRQIYKIPDEIIPSFKEPKKIARYFHEEIKQGMKEMGYSIDWRREFTTIDKGYSKLISWQFRNLRKNGLIVQGSHPVGWCPQDQSPVSQHDTVGDIEPELIGYDLIKFKFEDYLIPTATLRPETLFGVTNLWVNPDILYVIALINNEKWIITKEASRKLEYLDLSVSVVSEIKGSELIGKSVFNQLNNTYVPVFPASFVDPNNGTGIVMSVPAHAPYDYQAMIDLMNDDNTLLKYGIKVNIKPISIIHTDQFSSSSTSPAERILAQYSINNQNDPKLEEATNKLYSEEFHAGKILPHIDIIGNLSVLKAREIIREKIIKEGMGTTMYELKNEIKCRCGTTCVVKLLTNQWFINYGDKNWKNLAYELVDNMEIFPEEIRQEFKNVIDWLKERACARKSGLGTRLPWDNEWIIESLSDSVIYMAYYPLSKFINNDANLNDQHKVLADDLNDSFFDYVLLGKNDIDMDVVAKDSKISTELLERIKNEFLYFYPVDSRHSGRDLIPNHLTFFIFNHTAIFPKDNWPKQIVVNGSVLMDGKKMSKSLGNIIPLRQAIDEYGADPIRLTMLASSEILQDSDFSFDSVKAIRSKLYDIYRTMKIHKSLFTIAQNSLDDVELEDDWISSRIQRIVLDTTSAIEKFRIREALHNILYLMDNDLQWYQKRKLAKKKSICNIFLKEFLITRIKLLAPFAPFFSEELWEIFGNKPFVSCESWPEVNDSKISLNSEDNEKLIQDMIFDIQKITKVTKIVPQKIMIYTASTAKNKLYKKLLDRIQKESTANFGVIMKELVNDHEIKDFVKRSPDLVRKMIQDILSESLEVRDRRLRMDSFDEMIPLQDGMSLLRNEIGDDKLEVKIFSEDDGDKYDPKQKSRFSRPYKPAIFIE
jgi:leucyl-tRNA synthetase